LSANGKAQHHFGSVKERTMREIEKKEREPHKIEKKASKIRIVSARNIKTERTVEKKGDKTSFLRSRNKSQNTDRQSQGMRPRNRH